MIQIYKVKEPGDPVSTFTAKRLKDEDPVLYSVVKYWPLGSKRIVKFLPSGKLAPPRHKGTVVKVGVHKLHPRELSPKARKKICGKGLRGKARELFIEKGLTFAEQREQGRLQADLEVSEIIRKYREEHPEEYATRELRRAQRKEERRKKIEKETGRKVLDYSKFVTPSQIAKEAELSPSEVRKFLRMKKIGKRGGRYAFKRKEADRIIRAARKHYQGK